MIMHLMATFCIEVSDETHTLPHQGLCQSEHVHAPVVEKPTAEYLVVLRECFL